MNKQEFEKGLVAKYGAGKVAHIPVKGGYAYFRQPSVEEWEEMLTLRESAGASRTPYYRLVTMCFCGAWIDGEISGLSLEDITEREGAAFMNSAAGGAVNQLAGTGDRQTTFLE